MSQEKTQVAQIKYSMYGLYPYFDIYIYMFTYLFFVCWEFYNLISSLVM